MATRAKLTSVADELQAMDADRRKQSGIVDIRGKSYETVASRVHRFREAHPLYALLTEVAERDAECVVVRATIADETGRPLATGHAEEYRKASQINRTSALENAETSAIGRALAALGFGGTEFATANEVQNAVHQQANPRTGEIPPAKPQKLDGPYTCKTQLQTAAKQFVRTLESMGDLDEFVAWTQTDDYREFCEQLARDMPSWWETGEGLPEEFVPLEIRVRQKREDLERAEANKTREKA